MAFSNLFFVFFFLPFVIMLYYVGKEKYRNYILLIASLLFYAYGEPTFVFVMMISIVVNYFMAILIENCINADKINVAKLLTVADVIANLSLFFVFKYLNLAISTVNLLFHTGYTLLNIKLPIGISFFTFQALSYVIDVNRKQVKAQRNLLYLALYISFFPQLIAGPIVRYSTIEMQIIDRTCTYTDFAEGIRRFFIGFAKKVLLANNVAIVASDVFGRNSINANPLLLWMGAICYTLQIFYDFAGYSDMAIGLGKMFGFKFEENFNYPYIANTISDFWRRWHISLGTWFKDYVYFPMGGSKVSVPRHIFNMFVVWSLTGIWHGAAYPYLAWGIGFFFLLAIEKYIVKPEQFKSKCAKILWQIITLVLIICSMVIFNSDSVRKGIRYCMAMFGRYHVRFVIDSDIIYNLREYGVFILLGMIFSTPIMRSLCKRLENSRYARAYSIVFPIICAFVFMWSVSCIILGAHNPFIYFNF